MSQIESNFLTPLNYSFSLKRAPNVEFTVQRVQMPNISLGEIIMPTPFSRHTLSGKMQYDGFSITFRVGEFLMNYLEIYNWMVERGFPDEFTQYKNLTTDATLLILNNAKNVILEVNFTDVFPTNLSNLSFDSTLQEVAYSTAEVTFSFDRMYFKNAFTS